MHYARQHRQRAELHEPISLTIVQSIQCVVRVAYLCRGLLLKSAICRFLQYFIFSGISSMSENNVITIIVVTIPDTHFAVANFKTLGMKYQGKE